MTRPPPTSFDEFLDRLLGGEELDADAFVRAHPDLPEAERRQLSRLCLSPRGASDPAPGGGAAEELATDAPPIASIGGFKLGKRIGAGAMGAVFLARDESLGREIAVKILGPDLVGGGEQAGRFLREVRAVASLRHPNIVTVHAAGEQNGLRYMAMELVAGSSLQEVIAAAAAGGSRLAISDVLRWGIDIASALRAAHEAGIIHRDVKPPNIRIAADGRAVLLDFGLAREADAATLTESGTFRGSPQYASPEQVGLPDVAIDGRTDVYSLGATLYEALTGIAPFRGQTRDQLFHEILSRDPVPLRRLEPSLPRDLETVVLATLDKDPARRHPTAAALEADLMAVRDGRPVSVRPPSAIGRMARWASRQPGKAALASSLVVAILLLATSAGFIVTNLGKIRKAAADERALDLARILEDGFVEYGEGDPEQARSLFADALRAHPDSAEAKAGFALATIDCGDPAGALAFLERSTNANDPWARSISAAARRGLGATTESRAIDLTTSPPATAIDHFVLGINALNLAHHGDKSAAASAVDHLQEAVLSAPPTALYHYELGHAAWHAGRHKEARMVAAAIKRHWPASPERSFAIGRTLFDADREASYVALAEAARNPPRSPTAIGVIVTLLADSARADLVALAVDLGRSAASRHPTNAAIRAALSAALRGRGDVDGAISEGREAVRLAPRNGTSNYRLAEALVVKKDYAGALESARAAASLKPWDSRAWNVLGIALLDQGEADEAVRSFEKSLALLPDSASTLCNFGRALKRAGDFAGALEKLEAGDRMGSKDPRWTYPSKKWVTEARQLVALEKRLDQIRSESGKGPSPAELVVIARRVLVPKRRHAEAAAFFERAFREEPALLAQTSTDVLGEAVAAAAAAGLGKGADAPSDPSGRTRLLATARGWIAGVMAHSIETDDAAASRPITPLLRVKAWLADPAVAATRTPGSFADAAEAAEWRKIWQELEPALSR